MIISIYLFCLCYLVNAYSGRAENFLENTNENPVISICDGKIRGKRATTVGQKKSYVAFQGIPYAEPPVGDLRFKPPVKKSKWRGVLSATEDKSQCLQETNPAQGSEDCLHISVYVPSINKKNIPVMVWIFGGSFAFGNSSYSSYPPDYLLDEEVIFVSFNYRLGIFGFGSTGDAESPRNIGLKDNILALKWVQDNIAFFGGDPRKVTIFGESSGAASVSYLAQTNVTKELFNAAIMSSGTSLCVWTLDTKSRETMFSIGKALNINTKDSATLINALKLVDARKLQEIAYNISMEVTLNDPLGGLTFGPIIEPGIIEKHGEQVLFEGRFPRRPLIIGFTSNESGTVGEGLTDYLRADRGIDQLVPINLSRNRTKILRAASKINSFYFGTSPMLNQTEAAINYLNDNLFFRPIIRTVEDQSKYVPVYFYKFSYSNGSSNGAAHAEDLPYVFAYNVTLSPEGELVRLRTARLWANFAKYGNPTPRKDAFLQSVSWLPANGVPNKKTYLNIDSNLAVQEDPVNTRMNFWNDVYKEFGDPPYDTY